MNTPPRPDRETWHALEQAHLLVDSLHGAADPADAPCAAWDAQTVQQYLAGTLDTVAAQRVVEHLTACEACRRLMSAAVSPPDGGQAAPTTLARGQLDALLPARQQPQTHEASRDTERQADVAQQHEHEC